MALDNNTQSDETTQTHDEAQPWDADLPVDADAEANNAGIAAGTNKKKVAGIGIIVGLLVLAVIATFSLRKKSPPTDTPPAPPIVAQAPPAVPVQPVKKASKPASTNPSAPKTPVTANPPEVAAGPLKRPGTQNWVKGVTKPLPVPNGLEATPGQPGSSTPQVRVVKSSVGASSAAPANSKAAAMKKLWNEGAQAKHKGNNAAARKAWQQILELDPQHPGIQEAISKLGK